MTSSAIAVPSSANTETEIPQTYLLDIAIVEEADWNGLAYHALHQPSMRDPPAVRALLPLFYEKSATPSMVKHGVNAQKQAVEYLNSRQILVTTFDQTLFALV